MGMVKKPQFSSSSGKSSPAPILVACKVTGKRFVFLDIVSGGAEPQLIAYDENGDLHSFALDDVRIKSVARFSPSTIMGHRKSIYEAEPSLDRFTDRARRVVRLGRDAARDAGVDSTDSARLLAGLLVEGSGVGASVLRDRMGVDLASLRDASLKPGSDAVDAEGIFERAREVARALSFDHIGTEVLLIALREVDGSASQTLLAEAGVGSEELRREIQEHLGR